MSRPTYLDTLWLNIYFPYTFTRLEVDGRTYGTGTVLPYVRCQEGTSTVCPSIRVREGRTRPSPRRRRNMLDGESSHFLPLCLKKFVGYTDRETTYVEYPVEWVWNRGGHPTGKKRVECLLPCLQVSSLSRVPTLLLRRTPEVSLSCDKGDPTRWKTEKTEVNRYGKNPFSKPKAENKVRTSSLSFRFLVLLRLGQETGTAGYECSRLYTWTGRDLQGSDVLIRMLLWSHPAAPTRLKRRTDRTQSHGATRTRRCERIWWSWLTFFSCPTSVSNRDDEMTKTLQPIPKSKTRSKRSWHIITIKDELT